MAFLFDEDFESYAVGATLPLGPFSGNGGNVQNFGDTDNKCYGGFFNGFVFTAPNNIFSLCFGFLLPDAGLAGNGVIWSLANENPSNPSQSKFITSFVVELDKSLSALTNGAYLTDTGGKPLNTLIQSGFSIEPSQFYFISLLYDFEEDATTHNIVINLTVYIDGKLIMQGSADSGVNVFTTYTGDAKVNKFSFSTCGINGSFIDNITCDLASSIFPHETLSANRYARVSAAVLEFLKQPSDENARVSQAVIEYLKLPSDMKAIVSAAVIELITKRSSIAGRGWLVKEC